jgi:hypothetical protein
MRLDSILITMVLLWCLLFSPSSTSVAAEPIAEGWGHIAGQVRVAGGIPLLPPKALAEGLCPARDVPDDTLVVDPTTGGLCYVLVYLSSRPGRIHPDRAAPPSAAVQQQIADCRFVPHAVILRTGQTVELTDLDPVPHLLRYAGFQQSGTLTDPTRSGVLSYRPQQAERLPVRVSCDVHGYMTGWWLIVNHPYAAVTDVEGRFTIPDLPAGEHELTIWHERVGYLARSHTVQVIDGETVLLDFEVPAERLLKLP